MRAAIGGLVSLCIAGAPLSAAPVHLIDALGRAVVLPEPPRRIVTIFSSNTELVAALGLTDRIVGIDAFTRYPADAATKPVVGGRLGFSVDAVVAQAPDLVLVTPARQAAYQLVAPMERLGVPVLVLTSRSVEEVLGNILLVGRAMGEAELGRQVADALEARLARVAAAVSARRCPRIVLVTGRLGNGLLLIARPNTYTADALARAGGCPALTGRGDLAQVSPEALLAADPDVLLLAGRMDELRELTARPGFREMRAVQEGRAFVVPRAEFLIPGPRTVDGIERLAALLHPATGRRP
ncbi:iron complex transport system substrate-binding protein [Methylobacterium sp. UNC300MFChir4.1]|jgi:iron complex transport system substrate-binding protein|uniref:ABC transporter substrate-binding protein n=1 Tax=Methylobacterium sp. UNC300MFChir4.1 TaxID=1502747 RepID=UPI0008C131CA|nr:ABC transporter substrate-binding protein [Methylobacterium sp. UNC300MFChir4.1]SEP30473.1 iron complex transport system substrate-binding protein [Methylobacterium sp. UNC300MFChir4.1]